MNNTTRSRIHQEGHEGIARCFCMANFKGHLCVHVAIVFNLCTQTARRSRRNRFIHAIIADQLQCLFSLAKAQHAINAVNRRICCQLRTTAHHVFHDPAALLVNAEHRVSLRVKRRREQCLYVCTDCLLHVDLFRTKARLHRAHRQNRFCRINPKGIFCTHSHGTHRDIGISRIRLCTELEGKSQPHKRNEKKKYFFHHYHSSVKE